MKLIRVKAKDAKKCDLKPSQRIKVSGNVFVEVYKDNKGYFYRIDIPGATDFVSKERYPHPDKASLAGRTHAQKFMKKIRGDEKVGDIDSFNVKAAKNLFEEATNSVATAIEKIRKVGENIDNWTTEERKAITPYMKNFDNMIKTMEIYKRSISNWIK